MRTFETIVGWVFLLVLVFLLLSRAAEANSVINSAGGFGLNLVRDLQGVYPSGYSVVPGTSATQGTGANYLGGLLPSYAR